jgi:hypothetical protein
VAHRATPDMAGDIANVLCSSRYSGLSSSLKVQVAKKYFGDIVGRVDEVLPYIERSHSTVEAKERYANGI